MLTLEKIKDAQRVLKDVARHTDLIKAPLLTDQCKLYLKPENLQFTGSFKLRGAGYKIACLSEEEKSHGIIACSAGNHAQGVAVASTKYGIKAVICMPETTPLMKVEATRNYGAEVVLVPGVYDDAYEKAVALQKEKGYTFVHPFNDENVMAGQGTIGLEILEELPDADIIVTGIGGGGLISGIAAAAKAIKPDIKVYGVQAAGAASMYEAVRQGRIVKLPQIHTFADGIAVREAGTNTFENVKKYVDEIVTVTEDEIAMAILRMMEKQKMVAEGAGAVSVAAVLTGKIPCEGKKVVCVISGGNIDVSILSNVIERGMIYDGRRHKICVDLTDKPGQLASLTRTIAEAGGNIKTVNHIRASDAQHIGTLLVELVIETGGHEHIRKLDRAVRKAGFLISKKEY